MRSSPVLSTATRVAGWLNTLEHGGRAPHVFAREGSCISWAARHERTVLGTRGAPMKLFKNSDGEEETTLMFSSRQAEPNATVVPEVLGLRHRLSSIPECVYALLAHGPDQALKQLDSGAEPFKLFNGNSIMPRISCLHIGGAQQLVCAPLRLRLVGPHLGQPRLQLLRELAEPVQAMRFWTVERADQEDAVIEALGCLV